MPTYLVESYLADSDGAVVASCERARLVPQLDPAITYVRTTFLPEDETILHLFDAPSAEALERARTLAALPSERIVAAVEQLP